MILVTPKQGEWPEPRPQHLITGDRAVWIVDPQSAAALYNAGVKLVTITGAAFGKLITELVPEVMDGIDPVTGKLTESVMPSWLTQAAIADVDIRGSDGKIEEQYLPARLSAAALNAQMSSSGGTSTSSATMTTANIGTGVITNLTATTANVTDATVSGALEAGVETLRKQSAAPANPAADKVRLYVGADGRLVSKDSTAQLYRIPGKRIVSSWPLAGDSYIGDEAINGTTGEHRIYKGATLGWRLASPHVVTSLAERNALTNKYEGYKVWCDFGYAQEHYWSAGKWFGTKAFHINGIGNVGLINGNNDTNWRRWATLTVGDPGYGYKIFGTCTLEIVQTNQKYRAEVWWSMCDVGGANFTTYHRWYADPDGAVPAWWAVKADFAPLSWEVQNGTRQICVDWRVRGNNSAAFSGNYEQTNDYLLVPA